MIPALGMSALCERVENCNDTNRGKRCADEIKDSSIGRDTKANGSVTLGLFIKLPKSQKGKRIDENCG